MKTKQTNKINKMKKIFKVVFILFLVFGSMYVLGSIYVSAHECTKTERHKKELTQAKHHRTGIKPSRFMEIHIENGKKYDHTIRYEVIVDKKTRVQYIYIFDLSSGFSGVTPLLDSLGKPILYRGEI